MNLILSFRLAACLAVASGLASAQTNGADHANFSFTVAGDMRNFTHATSPDERQFDGACEAMKSVGAGEFMIVPGDFDPPGPVRATVDEYLGTNFICYFAVGDHERQTPASMAWFRHWGAADHPQFVRRGPAGAETTEYSFDFADSHFVVLSDYFDGRNDAAKPDISDATIAWLEQDLAATRQPLIWIVSHKPLECLPDMDNGRQRHAGDACVLDPALREKFAALLKKHQVCAFICGHTHGCSIARVHGLWQADSGHARGAGDPGAPSTFLKFRVQEGQVAVDVYRADVHGKNYRLKKTMDLRD